MTTSEKIIKYITDNTQATGDELARFLGISNRATRKQLKSLFEKQKLEKSGMPPKVFYRIPIITEKSKPQISAINHEHTKYIEGNFLYITPLGEYIEGMQGFIKWCDDRGLSVETQVDQYIKITSQINKFREKEVIIATNKFNSSMKETHLKQVFYLDFYSIPQFGKTKLGQLLLYAKQSQDRKRIKMISEEAKPKILKIIKNYKIDAVGFIPPTVKREVQFMRELEKNLDLAMPIIKIAKIRTNVIVPQKSLSKMSDRIINARNTIIVEEKRKFNNILLIDDAVGSGATLNGTAKQIIDLKLAHSIFGLAITGSYKGFEVISEV